MTAVTAAVGLAMISQPASAKPTAQTANVQRVAIGDLDLARESDAKVLIRRVNQAAHAVCTGTYDGWQQYLSASGWYRDCVRDASSRAVASLDNPMVTAMYQDGRRPIRLAASTSQP